MGVQDIPSQEPQHTCMFIQAPITLKEWQKRDEEAGAEQDAAQ